MFKRIATLLLVLSFLLPFASLAEEAAQDPTHAAIEEVVAVFLQAEFVRQAGLTESGWERFIYEQGAADITMDLAKFDVEKGKALTVNFLVASALPDVKKQPKYEGDPAAWLQGVVDTMRAQDTKAKTSLMITAEASGFTAAYADKAEAALQKSVKNLGTKAAKAFSDKTILGAVTDYLMPTPIAVPRRAPEILDAAEYTPAFTAYLARNDLDLDSDPIIPAILYAFKGYKLDAAAGPEAFTFTYTMPDLSALIATSAETLGRDLAYDAQAKEYSEEEQTAKFTGQVEKDVAAYRHGRDKGTEQTYTFSLLALPNALSPDDFYTDTETSADTAFYDGLLDVQLATALLPEYPAVARPKTGQLAGDKGGLGHSFVVYDDGYDRYVEIYNAETDEFFSSFYIRSGSTCGVRLPSGYYYYRASTGEVWYGSEYQFGDFGDYYSSAVWDIERNMKYTFYLNPKPATRGEDIDVSWEDGPN